MSENEKEKGKGNDNDNDDHKDRKKDKGKDKAKDKDKQNYILHKSSPEKRVKSKKLFAFWGPSSSKTSRSKGTHRTASKEKEKEDKLVQVKDEPETLVTTTTTITSTSTPSSSNTPSTSTSAPASSVLSVAVRLTRSTPSLPTLEGNSTSEPSSEDSGLIESHRHGSAPARQRSILNDVRFDEEEEDKARARQRRSVGAPVKRMSTEESSRFSEAAKDRRKSGGRAQTFTGEQGLNPFAAYPEAPSPCSGVAISGCALDDRVVKCSLRFSVGYAETIGRRDKMEDTIVVHGQLCGTGDLFAIFDGHNGASVAQFLRLEIPQRVEEHLAKMSPVEALTKTFISTNKLLKKSRIVGGSTALVVLCVGDTVYLANVGDSRAVLCRKSRGYRLTRDHRPTDEREAKRIQENGGEIIATMKNGKLKHRVGGILGVTRSFGDFEVGQAIAPEPEITELKISENFTSEDDVLVIGCDGLYDALQDAEVAEVATSYLKHHKKDVQGLSKRLRDIAYARQSKDNISVMAILKSDL